MPDIIQLLPDNIANQIAAGEVIQRPGSAVKELLENAVDAGATEIKLIVVESGKALIQVIDNGRGMSDLDARMCFERHATSKIRDIHDLFHIRTMGFRGEALASIAAVAQVELKTKRAEDEFGTYLEIENSVVKKQEPVATANGTCITMKNLFFNIPARRNFLKSNAAELRHLIDEFTRVAMSFPDIFFSLNCNGQEVYHLERGSLKQRIVQLMGNNFNSKLVNVNEQTDYLNITGFAGKPETARKTRGEQYFFVNNRFIKSAYLNHAVMKAYQDLIPADAFPLYVLFIDLDPAQIDVNVHPTKQEIKFEDEKIVYAFVQSAVKHSLAQFSITPTLDFNLDPAIQHLESISQPVTDNLRSAVSASPIYQSFTRQHQAHIISSPSDLGSLKKAEDYFSSQMVSGQQEIIPDNGHTVRSNPLEIVHQEHNGLAQLLNTYITAETNKGFILIHQQHAHERILYERYQQAASTRPVAVQRNLFPVSLQLNPADAVMLHELSADLLLMGYHIEPFGKDSFVIQGTPADVNQGQEKQIIENILEQVKHFSNGVTLSKREKLIRSLAAQHAIRPGTKLGEEEMINLVEELFNCLQPNVTASGQPTYISFKQDYLGQLFKRN